MGFIASLAAIAGLGLAGLCLLGVALLMRAVYDWASPFGPGLLVLRDRKPSASALSGSIPDAKKAPLPKLRGGDDAAGGRGANTQQSEDTFQRPRGGSL